jgi:hypothetical protein
MRFGRETMKFGEKVRHADWGIPVLHAAHPDFVIFPRCPAVTQRARA